MKRSFNWHNLPQDMRLGSSPGEELLVYRGFDPTQEDPAVGFLSAAYANGSQEIINDVIARVEQSNIGALMEYVAPHTQPGGWRDRGLTPFVSATPDQYTAERYARNKGEQIATILVRADQLVTDAFFAYEALVLGSVSPEQIVAVEDTPVVPKSTTSYTSFLR